MLCRDFAAKTTDYLEGALEETERREWESHASRCPGCARYITQIRMTIELLAGMRSSSLEEASPRVLH